MNTKMKPGNWSRDELQAALMYPDQASPELKRAMLVMAARDGKRSALDRDTAAMRNDSKPKNRR